MKKLTIPEMNRLTPEQFHAATKLPFVVVLDNVRSVHNVGAVFRTADAFLIEAVYLCGISCCPPNVEMHKTALGAELTVDWRHFDSTLDAVQDLKQRGYRVYAVEQAHDSQTLKEVLPTLFPYSSTPLPLYPLFPDFVWVGPRCLAASNRCRRHPLVQRRTGQGLWRSRGTQDH